jgi:hypothetical protein
VVFSTWPFIHRSKKKLWLLSGDITWFHDLGLCFQVDFNSQLQPMKEFLGVLRLVRRDMWLWSHRTEGKDRESIGWSGD